MNGSKRITGGSRFLYEAFDHNAARIEAQEMVMAEKWTALERRLAQIETMLERQERRLWLAVYGAAAFFAGDQLYQLFSQVN